MGLASSEGLGRTAMSGSDSQVPNADTAARFLRRTYALSCCSSWIHGTRPRSWLAPCSVRPMTTSSSLFFNGFDLRTLLPANANGRERCPGWSVYVWRATGFTSILATSLQSVGFGTGRPTDAQGDKWLTSPSVCGSRSEALMCSVPEARGGLARGFGVRPNVRVKLAPTAWRAGQHAHNGPQAQRLMSSAPRRWCRLNSNVRPHTKNHREPSARFGN